MRVNVALSTGKSSKQTQQWSSVCVVGGGFEEGLKEDDPLEDDDLDFVAVGEVSFALRFAGFKALDFESIPMAT